MPSIGLLPIVDSNHIRAGQCAGPLRSRPEGCRPAQRIWRTCQVEDRRVLGNWGDQPDSHRHSRLHGAGCCCYIMITIRLRAALRRDKSASRAACRAAACSAAKSEGWSPWSDSHRRIRVHETRPVAAEAQELLKLALSHGLAPRTSAFAKRRAESAYTLRATGVEPTLASVAGLAPARPGLKIRVRELLCIHGRLAGWRQMVPEVGSAPTSPPLQGGANLPQLLGGGRPGR